MFDRSRWHYKRKVRDVGSYRKLGGQVVMWGLTVLPKPALSNHLLCPWKNVKKQHNCIQLIFLMMKKMNKSHYTNPSKKSQKGKIIKFNNNNHIIETVFNFLIHAIYIKCYTNVLPYVSNVSRQGRLLLFHNTVLGFCNLE